MRHISLITVFLVSITSLLYSQDPLRFQKEIKVIDLDNSHKVNSHDLLVFTGSSSIRLWQDIKDYFPGKNIINTGFGGSQMSDLLYYSDTVIIKYRPVQVFIYEGDNDIAAGKKAADVIKDALTLCKRISVKLPEAQIVFISVKPSPLRWKLKDEYIKLNAFYRQLSIENKSIKFIDIWPQFLSPLGLPRKDLYVSDSLHINKSGYDIWAVEIKKIIK